MKSGRPSRLTVYLPLPTFAHIVVNVHVELLLAQSHCVARISRKTKKFPVSEIVGSGNQKQTYTFMHPCTAYAIGAADVFELPANLPALDDSYIHLTITIHELDSKQVPKKCLINEAKRIGNAKAIVCTAFGILDTNSAVAAKDIEA
jgi:3-oxoacyl-(acyl-carrier-protein) synthase